MSAGKGDRPRSVDKKSFDAGYDRAFSTCDKHPRYKALRKPRADCIVCRRLWNERRLGL